MTTKQAAPATPLPHTYRPLLRPASMVTLPRGIKWEFVAAPWDIAHIRTDIQRAPTRHGIIATDRRLTEEELADFALEVV